MTNQTLGTFLRETRESRNQSLQDARLQIDISKMYLSQIERDVRVPSDTVLKKIADHYNVDETFLFELIGRVPLSTKEELAEHVEIQRLLAQSKTLKVKPCIKKEMYSEIINVFKKYIH